MKKIGILFLVFMTAIFEGKLTISGISSIKIVRVIVVLLLNSLSIASDSLFSGDLIAVGLTTAGSAVSHFLFIDYLVNNYYCLYTANRLNNGVLGFWGDRKSVV